MVVVAIAVADADAGAGVRSRTVDSQSFVRSICAQSIDLNPPRHFVPSLVTSGIYVFSSKQSVPDLTYLGSYLSYPRSLANNLLRYLGNVTYLGKVAGDGNSV